MRFNLLLVVGVALLALNGCASTGSRYEWQNYDRELYATTRIPTTAQAFLLKLETQARALEQSGQLPPPGIHAEIRHPRPGGR